MKFLLRIAGAAAFALGSTAFAAEVDKFAIVMPGAEDPSGWAGRSVQAARAAAEVTGVDLILIESAAADGLAAATREAIAEGADLVIVHAPHRSAAAQKIAEETAVPVALLDKPYGLRIVRGKERPLAGHEGAFLAGRLAAKMTKTGAVGVIAAGEPPAWTAQSAGFAQGANLEDPLLKVFYTVVDPDSPTAETDAERQTKRLIAAGADIVFGQTAGSIEGVVRAIESHDSIDGSKVLLIDLSGARRALDSGHLLTAILWDMTPIYTAMIRDLRAGAFGGRSYDIRLRDGSVKLLRTAEADPVAWDEIMEMGARIASGEMVIAPIFDAAALHRIVAVSN